METSFCVASGKAESAFYPQSGMIMIGGTKMPDVAAVNDDFLAVKSFLDNAQCLNSEDKSKLYEYLYCITAAFSINTFEDYFTAYKVAVRNGFDTVIDIGCAAGHQAELFRGSTVRYVGIESCPGHFWRPDEITYFTQKYPCSIPNKIMDRRVLGVSRLCVGYLTIDYESIAQQFNSFLLSGPPDACIALSGLYETAVSIIDPENQAHPKAWTWFQNSKLIL